MTAHSTTARAPAFHAARAEAYRFFATAFRYPDGHVAAALAAPPSAEALAPALEGHEERAFEVAASLRAIAPALAARSGSIEDEFLRAFGHSVPKEFPPFETEFTSADAFRQTTELADIAGFYRAFGVRVVPALGERVDALEVELEFLHLLAMKEAHALGTGRPDLAEICSHATRKFILEHLGRWALSFAKRLARKGASPLYGALGEALGAWLRADLESLEIATPQQVDEPALLRAPDWNAQAEEALTADEQARAELEQLERARAEGAVRSYGTAPPRPE